MYRLQKASSNDAGVIFNYLAEECEKFNVDYSSLSGEIDFIIENEYAYTVEIDNIVIGFICYGDGSKRFECELYHLFIESSHRVIGVYRLLKKVIDEINFKYRTIITSPIHSEQDFPFHRLHKNNRNVSLKKKKLRGTHYGIKK